MKTILSILTISFTSIGFSQENLRTTSFATSNGSFVNIESDNQLATARDAKFETSTFSSSGGGSATLVKFDVKRNASTVGIHASNANGKKAINPVFLKVSVYPNPATQELNIKIYQNGESQACMSFVRIKNMLGQSVYEQTFMGNESKLDVSQLLKGFFFIEISNSDGGVYCAKKIIIQ